MKLVAAKCPSCGASIDVDKDSDSTKCEFCKSKIIVDDAIQRYKIELSGEVEVKNLPKADNLMRLADMHYKDQEYDEAYEKYSRACELDPNNAKAILRKGICKTLLVNYPKFDIVSAMNAVKNSYNILEKDKENNIEEINKIVADCNNAIVLTTMKINDYAATHAPTQDDVIQMNAYLRACLTNQEYLYSLIINSEGLELALYNSMCQTIDFFLKPKKMQSSLLNSSGRPIIINFTPGKKQILDVNTVRNKYKVRYNYIMNKRGQ